MCGTKCVYLPHWILRKWRTLFTYALISNISKGSNCYQLWVRLCFPRHIHCSCSTVMALLCTPVSELVSCTFSTIPICPLHFLFTLSPLFFYLRPANFMDVTRSDKNYLRVRTAVTDAVTMFTPPRERLSRTL